MEKEVLYCCSKIFYVECLYNLEYNTMFLLSK